MISITARERACRDFSPSYHQFLLVCFCVILTSGPDQFVVHVLSILFDHSLPATIARVTVTTYVVSSVLMVVVVEMS